MKKTILSLLVLLCGCYSASAQEAKTIEVFNPHWYVSAQIGGQYTLGEIDFIDLISPNAQVSVGYNFSKLFGARLSVGAWQSKGGVMAFPSNHGLTQTFKYKWNYVAPTVDATFDVTNAIWGFNHKRVFDLKLFAGIGANIAFNNGEAATAREAVLNAYYVQNMKLVDDVQYMDYLWSGTKVLPTGRFGIIADFKVSDRVALGIEANANFLNEHYNSKNAGNSDWYFNLLGGVKIALGKTHVSKSIAAAAVAPVIRHIDTVYIQKKEIVHDTIYVQSKAMPEVGEKIRRDVFFTIANSQVVKNEMPKVEDIANYMKKYPASKVTITGYADKGTGSAKGNVVYAKKRAQIVADILTSQYGISSNRITVDSKGDTVQPYEQNELNRVSICIAE